MNGFPRYVILPAMLLLAVRAIRNDEDDDDQATASTGAASRSVSQLNTSTDKEESGCSCGSGFCAHVTDATSQGCYTCLRQCERAKTASLLQSQDRLIEESGDAKLTRNPKQVLLEQQGHVEKITEHAEQQHHVEVAAEHAEKKDSDCTCGGTGFCQHVKEGDQNGCFVCQEQCAKTHKANEQHPSAVKAPASTESGLLSLSQLNTASDKDSLMEESGDAKLTRNPKQVLLEQQGHVKKITEHAEQQHHVKVAAEHAEKKDDPEKHPEKDDEKKDEKKDEKTEEKTDDKKVAAKSFAAGRAAHTAVWLVASGVVAYMSA